ncbi:type 1 glutamine amidotransferase [Natronomonas sp. EA1]|uniref:type 1 glutamine amidotransferase n=1 Tax=Natronomonas sp. EA1 TaxID=3421655 RepID=UPI003EB71808
MTRLRLALINAAHEAQDTSRNFRRELDADLAEFRAAQGELPPDFDFDGIVVTGSRSSVYWDEEWIEPTKAWVGEALDRGLPALGICYGHQLLADVLGGTVEDMGDYEIGYRTVQKTADSPLLADVDEEFLVFTTHSDTVSELPPGATLIAENDFGVHGFQHGHVFGLQSHPEYDVETARAITESKDLDEAKKRAVLDGITEENYATASRSKRVFDNFLAYVREVRAERQAV